MTPRIGEEENEKTKEAGPKTPDNIEAKLLEARTILVEGPVNDKLYHAVVARLYYLEAKDPKANILVVINSPGGSADSGFGIYDVMRFLSCPITTLTAGLCASAGVLIHLGGAKGRRFVLPNSRFLLHQPSTQMFGQASDMEISAKEILRMRKRFAAIVATEVGSTQEKIEGDSNRDFWLGAEESVKYGLADKVVATRAEIQ